MSELSQLFGGRYQVVREIGAGSMGHVYQAVDMQTGRSVAAKVMIAGSDHNLEAVLRFYQEAAILSRLKHPNIVEVYGTLMEDRASCIIMELLEGRSLGQVLASEHLTLTRVKSLLLQVTAALHYAHGRGVVHRDIKPDNIMIVGDDHVKVTDFGIARVLGVGMVHISSVGQAIGTPLYMSPEQITGPDVDGRSDIYSLGAVLYQMVTGRPPFVGKDPFTMAFQHVHQAPQSPSVWNRRLPEDWERLILKMLQKDPVDRFQTVASLEQAIPMLGVAGIADPSHLRTAAAQADAAPPATRPPEQAPPRGGDGLAAQLQVAGKPGIGGTASAVAEPVSPGRPARRSDDSVGSMRWPFVVGAIGLTLMILIGAWFVFRPKTPGSRRASAAPHAPRVTLLAVWDKGKDGGRLFGRPEDVEVDDRGTAYVADYLKDRILVLSPAGGQVRGIGSSGGGPAQLSRPSGVALDIHGNLYVADSQNSRIQKLSPDGKSLAVWGQRGSAPGDFNGPHDVAVDAQGNVFVTDFYNNRVQKISPAGTVLALWGTKGRGTGQFDGPTDLALDRQNNVYVSDFSNNRVEEFSNSGRLLAQWNGGRTGFIHPHGIAVDGQGNLYITDYSNNRVLEISPAGKVLVRWGTTGHGPEQFDRPGGVAVDAQGHVYVTDSGNARVREFSVR